MKHIVTGDRVNASAVLLPEGVLVIDTSVDTEGAQEIFAAARKQGRVLYIINTHEHGDHLAGNSLFPCPIISSAQARAGMEKTNTACLPTITFTDRLGLYLSEPVLLRHFGGHSPGSAVVYFPGRKLLFTGDLVFAGRAPYMGEAVFPLWLEALGVMETWEIETVVPGHGPQGGKELLAQQRQWLEDYCEKVQSWTKEGLSSKDMLERAATQFPAPEHWQAMLVKSFQLVRDQFRQ